MPNYGVVASDCNRGICVEYSRQASDSNSYAIL